MQLVCFTVFDSAVGAHIMPFFYVVRTARPFVLLLLRLIILSLISLSLLRILLFFVLALLMTIRAVEPEQKIALGNATEFLSSAQAT